VVPRTKFAPRKTPRQARSRETLDAIFEAALQVLEREEESDPPVSTIAERAGVSVGSLYQYFPSKEALVGALIRTYLSKRLAILEKDLEAAKGLPAEEAARRLIEGFVDGMAARSKVERAMVQFFCRAGDLFALTQIDDQMNGVIERFIRSLGPEVRPVNTEVAAFLVSNTLRTAVLLTILQKPERFADPAFKAELVRMISGYLKA
jgi:AcrR family transcriptional regulator